jgi:hypothetical protein
MARVNRLDALFRAARRAIRRGQLMTKGWCACSPNPVTGRMVKNGNGRWVWECGRCGREWSPWKTGFYNDQLASIAVDIEGGWSAIASWEEW